MSDVPLPNPFLACFFLFHLFLAVSPWTGQEDVSGTKSRVWGPGLDPSVVLPVRYFFIQTADHTGKDLNYSAGDDIFQISITALTGHCPIYQDLLDRKDGSFIVRFRLYDACQGLNISVLLKNGQHVAGSPYVFKELVVHTDCNCPVPLESWKLKSLCPSTIPQIKQDLAQFSITDIPVNVSKHFEELSKRYHPQSASFCHYIILEQRLYRKCFGEHVGFAMFMDQILLFLLRRTTLPDSEFISNLGDYPLVLKNRNVGPAIPVFSWCGSDDSFDIVMPTYDITESSLLAMDRVVLDMLSIQAPKTGGWNEKIPIAFWRGRDARQERLKLVDIARNHSDLIDAGLTNFFFFRDEEHLYGPKVAHVDFFQFFRYKYQINMDGTVAAYRFPYLLGGDSLIFKQDSQYYEHFYKDLEPWQHFIPVRRDLSDLVEKITWAINHDEEAQVIQQNAALFARENLLPHHVFCYHALLFEQWAHFVRPVKVIPADFDIVPQPTAPPGCLSGCLSGENYRFSDLKDEL